MVESQNNVVGVFLNVQRRTYGDWLSQNFPLRTQAIKDRGAFADLKTLLTAALYLRTRQARKRGGWQGRDRSFHSSSTIPLGFCACWRGSKASSLHIQHGSSTGRSGETDHPCASFTSLFGRRLFLTLLWEIGSHAGCRKRSSHSSTWKYQLLFPQLVSKRVIIIIIKCVVFN